MPTAAHNKQPPPRFPRSGIVLWRKLGPVLRDICSKLGLTLSVDGMDIEEIDGGFHLRNTGGTTGIAPEIDTFSSDAASYSVGDLATFTVVVTGGEPLWYAWFWKGSQISVDPTLPVYQRLCALSDSAGDIDGNNGLVRVSVAVGNDAGIATAVIDITVT